MITYYINEVVHFKNAEKRLKRYAELIKKHSGKDKEPDESKKLNSRS